MINICGVKWTFFSQKERMKITLLTKLHAKQNKKLSTDLQYFLTEWLC